MGERHQVVRHIDGLDDALAKIRVISVSKADLGKLDGVLRQARFQHPQSPLDTIQQWLVNLLLRFLQTFLGANGGVGPLIRTAFAILLLALVAAVAYLLARRSLGRLVVEAPTSHSSGEPVTSNAATERAADLVALGDYRAALRYLYLSTLLQLQERGILQLRPGLTNRDYVRLLELPSGHHDDVGVALAALTEEFDRVWYGHLPCGAADYGRCEELAGRVLGAPGQERVA
jgi:hypothetical protein